MCYCIQKIRWGKVFLAAFIYLVIAYALRQAEVLLTVNYYMMPDYLGVWSKLMMPTQGPPPLEFTLISVLFTFLAGIVIAAMYDFTKGLFEKGNCEKISGFTMMISVIILVVAYLPMLLLFNLPFILVVSWFVTSVLSVFLATIAFTKLMK